MTLEHTLLGHVLAELRIAFAELLGFVLLLPACLCRAWTPPVFLSSKPLIPEPGSTSGIVRRGVDEWAWGWLNPWYSNTEDGVSGQQAYVFDDAGRLVLYAATFPAWVPRWAIAYAWSAWRNGANNLKRPLR